uniref:Uncharacterized protein n=1 Tax=Anopheles christyi TaxID=43041 RepID=A0A182KDI3_9DIPT
MSLKTVTIALDNKLRSLRDSSIDSDRDQALESDGGELGGYGNGRHHSLHQQWSHMGRSSRPLTLGENIPYADESPERPLIQGRSKPARTLTGPSSGSGGNITNNNNNNNHEESGAPATPVKQQLKKAPTAHSQKSIDSGGTINSSTTNSCLTLVNEADATLDGEAGGGGAVVEGVNTHDEHEDGQQQQQQVTPVGKGRNLSLSSDETDTSTTSNPREKLTAATYRIDTEKLKKMNRILTQLERKANNLERKFNLNRSLSLNYKSPKTVDCCCTHHGLPVTHSSQAPLPHCCQHQQQPQQQHISNNLNNNNNNSTSCHNHNGSAGGGGATIGSTIVSLRSRFSLTKDEKTDKNINRRRQIHDTSSTHPSGTTSVTTGNGNASGSGNDSSSCGEPCGPQIILTPAAPPTATARQRRHVGSRSIRRRHTVGGTHDYYANKMNAQHHHHHHHHHQHPHAHHPTAGPGCCPVPQN